MRREVDLIDHDVFRPNENKVGFPACFSKMIPSGSNIAREANESSYLTVRPPASS